MFTNRCLTFFLGPLFSKKTWLALDFGVCTAAGISWLGNRCVQTPVFYIDEAHGLSEISRRLSAVMFAHRTPPNIPFHYSSFPGYDLTDPNDLAAISQNALSLNAQGTSCPLIVIDQPYGLHLGYGSSISVLQPIASSLQSLAVSSNAAIIVLLQTRTRSQRSALATALNALGANQVLGLDFYPTDMPKATPWNKLLPRYRTGYLHLRTLASASDIQVSMLAKIHATDAAFSLTAIDHIPNLQTLKLSTFQTVLGPSGFEILNFLLAKGSASTRQLIDGTNSTSPGRALNLIKELSKYGYIRRTQPGGKGIPTNYAITPAGSSLLQEFP